jgi:hypothetical protein
MSDESVLDNDLGSSPPYSDRDVLSEEEIKEAIEKNKTPEEKLQDRVNYLEEQLDKLSKFVTEEVPGQPRPGETPVDQAIRVMTDAQLKSRGQLLDQVTELSRRVINDIGGESRRGESSPEMALRLLKEKPDSKNDRIVRECKVSGEPYMVYRAKDTLALGALQFYMFRAVDEKCPDEFVQALKAIYKEFEIWRGHHWYRTRLPD